MEAGPARLLSPVAMHWLVGSVQVPKCQPSKFDPASPATRRSHVLDVRHSWYKKRSRITKGLKIFEQNHLNRKATLPNIELFDPLRPNNHGAPVGRIMTGVYNALALRCMALLCLFAGFDLSSSRPRQRLFLCRILSAKEVRISYSYHVWSKEVFTLLRVVDGRSMLLIETRCSKHP